MTKKSEGFSEEQIKLLKAMGLRIAERRAARGLTGMELAVLVGTSPTRICQWEGGAAPSLKFIHQLCKELGMTATELLGF